MWASRRSICGRVAITSVLSGGAVQGPQGASRALSSCHAALGKKKKKKKNEAVERPSFMYAEDGTPYNCTIGIEIHAQLLNKTKLFSPSWPSAHADPGTRVSPHDMGLPGSLPTLSRGAVDTALRASLALHAVVEKESLFDRKHYFYPDLPAGYQITQSRRPLASDGAIAIPSMAPWDPRASDDRTGRGEMEDCLSGWERSVSAPGETLRIARSPAAPASTWIPIEYLAMEQDSAKSTHGSSGATAVDLNRAGAPLLEMVSGPALYSPEEAQAYIRRMRALLRAVGASSADMYLGELRADVNVSVARADAPIGTLGQRVEIKNMNSPRNVGRALAFEIKRHIDQLSSGEEVRAATRAFSLATGSTIHMRFKEQALDYRFLPEPDLPSLRIREEEIISAAARLPELPAAREARLTAPGGITTQEYAALDEEESGLDWYEYLVGSEEASTKGMRGEEGEEEEEASDELQAPWRGGEMEGENQIFSAFRTGGLPEGTPTSMDASKSQAAGEGGISPRLVYTWLVGEVLGKVRGGFTEVAEGVESLQSLPFSPVALRGLLKMLETREVSAPTAKALVKRMLSREIEDPVATVVTEDLAQISDPVKLRPFCAQVVEAARVQEAESGHMRGTGPLIKEVGDLTGRRADPRLVAQLVAELVKETSPRK